MGTLGGAQTVRETASTDERGPGMTFHEVLTENRPAILKRWRDLTMESYPEDTARFLRRQKDRFQNPVGHAISEGVEEMLDWLIEPPADETLPASLAEIIRIRAVQDIPPSAAVTFVYLIKKIVREELKDAIRQGRILADLLSFESRVDRLALLSFDAYVESRERVHEVYKSSINREVYRFMQRANELYGDYRKVPGVGEDDPAVPDDEAHN